MNKPANTIDSYEDFETLIQRMSQEVEQYLLDYFPPQVTQSTIDDLVPKSSWSHDLEAYSSVLGRPIWDLISRKGKCWRPVFGMLLLRSLIGEQNTYDQLLCVCAELIHTGALIIDDIQDSSLLRRGDTSLHLKYGNAVAINAGNTLYFLPVPLIVSHKSLSDQQKFEMLKTFNSLQLQAHLGQSTDIYWSETKNCSYLTPEQCKEWQQKILQMYSYKTAAAVVGLAEACMIIADTDTQTKIAGRKYAEALGIAFQIIDDLNNLNSKQKTRKTYAEDIREGKMTYLILETLSLLKEKEVVRLLEILNSKELRNEEETSTEAIELIVSSEAPKKCYKYANDLLSKSWSCMSERLPFSYFRDQLQELNLNLVELAYQV